MSTINPTNTTSNPQLTGILNTVPMPRPTLSPTSSANVGASSSSFSITALNQQQVTGGAHDQVLVGGGVNGVPEHTAQPAAPITVATPPVATTTPATTTVATTTTTTPGNGSPLAEAISGFGKASRHEAIRAEIDGASFGFPSFNSTRKTNTAPAITWGPGWTKVEKNGMWWMEHTNGSKAVPALEYRITPRPADKVQTIAMANGWGKKFPDGSILVFSRTEAPYRLDPKGKKHPVKLGTITISGVKVRVFEASVVRTLDPNGKVDVFDSRGNVSKGTTRWNAALGAADAGALMGGGPAKGEGPAKGGGATNSFDILTQDVESLTAIARGIIGEIQSGNVDPARLASLQAQLSKLPSGILQAAGAAGTMVSDGSTATTGALPPAAGSASGGGAAAPIPGVDANPSHMTLFNDIPAKLSVSIPSDLVGRQARFIQLPVEIQKAIAAAYGSNQGSKAFYPDQLFAFSADGTVRNVGGDSVVMLSHVGSIRGAGPGEDRALTMRPNRQPGVRPIYLPPLTNTAIPIGPVLPEAAQGSSASGNNGGQVTTSATSAVGGGANSAQANKISLYAAGRAVPHIDFGGRDGVYTWRTLPPAVRETLLGILRSGSDEASKAFASRSGGGWSFDPNAPIVIDAGFASFPNGLSLVRDITPASGAATGGGGVDPLRVPPVSASASSSGATSVSHSHAH